jgi:Carboxypeptidase regulatory-like domain
MAALTTATGLSMLGSTLLGTLSAHAAAPLVQDTFQRADQTGWGTATDGSSWSTGSALSVASNEGVISFSGSSQFEALGTATGGDVDGLVRFSVQSAGETAGIILREQPNGNRWLGRYDGSGNLQVMYRVSGTWTTLTRVSFPVSLTQFYWLRFDLQASNIAVTGWPDGTQEPSSPTWTGTSGAVSAAGQMGLYGYATLHAPVDFDSFTVTPIVPPPPDSSISGTVTDASSGTPIQGIVVSTVPPSTTTTTDAQGSYTLGVAGNKTYTVVFTDPNPNPNYNENIVPSVVVPVGGNPNADGQLTAIPSGTSMDLFTQPDQTRGWGTSTDGHVWSSDLGTYPGVTAGITGGQAWVNTSTSTGTDFDTWMGDRDADQEVTVDLHMTTVLNDAQHDHGSRLMARVQNPTTFVLMTIDGPNAADPMNPAGELTLWVAVNNGWTKLATFADPLSIGTWYHAKLDVVGTSVQGKLWARGAAEPNWQISAIQTRLTTAGQAGVRTTGAFVDYANFGQLSLG